MTPRENLFRVFRHERPEWIPVAGHVDPYNQPSREGMDVKIHDRHDPDFSDDTYWQERRCSSREYLCSLKSTPHRIYPFHFVWNDFDTSSLMQYRGIKWHGHENEPTYNYDDQKCARMEAATRTSLLLSITCASPGRECPTLTSSVSSAGPPLRSRHTSPQRPLFSARGYHEL